MYHRLHKKKLPSKENWNTSLQTEGLGICRKTMKPGLSESLGLVTRDILVWLTGNEQKSGIMITKVS